MDVLKKYMLFVITVINFNWSKNTINYVNSIPTNERVAMNKNKLQEIFGPENVPRPGIFSSIGRDTSSAKKYMISLYKYTTSKSNEAQFANQTVVEKADTVVSFVNHAYLPRPNASDEDGAMFFDVQTLSSLTIERTLKSDLRIYLSTSSKSVRDNALKVMVLKIVIPRVQLVHITSRIINASTSQWHDFDILHASQSWREDESRNNGILIICTTMDNKPLTMSECGLIDFRGDIEKRPFLVSYYESGDDDEILAEQLPHNDDNLDIYKQQKMMIPDRMRRSLENLFSGAFNPSPIYPRPRKGRFSNTTCGRHDLYIKFVDLGWSEWIIEPDGYAAGYCGGECAFPLNDNMNASNHAIIQTLVHLILPSELPQPCCAPIKLAPQHVLFLDDANNVVMKRYQNMVVRDCGCQ